MDVSLRRAIGQEPDLELTWQDLPHVNPGELEDLGRLLFGLFGEGELQFVGRSQTFAVRLGSIVGALVSGDIRLHPGGGRMRQAGMDPTTARIEVYFGQAAYRREFELIRALKPPLNRIPKLGRPPSRPSIDQESTGEADSADRVFTTPGCAAVWGEGVGAFGYSRP